MKETLVTGGTGMVGSSFKDIPHTVLVGSKYHDLKNYDETLKMMLQVGPDQVVHLAAKVGGVLGNMTFAGEYFRDNTLMNTNVLEAARVCGVTKVLSLLSTCIYPDQGPYPLVEKDLHAGPPHESNFAYAYSKRMLEIQSRAYRKQYGLNYICAVPNNLYGEHDNFEEPYSHVIPSLIRKMCEAKLHNKSEVKLWGTGEALREFTYSKDISKIIMMLLESYDDAEPINIGNTHEISIKNLANLIKQEVEFDGKIIWDISMPTGQLRKPSSNKKFITLYPDFEYTPLEVGIKQTCKWFMDSYPNIRGI